MILSAAGYIVAANAIEKSGVSRGAGAAADVGFRIAARYAVGAHHLLGREASAQLLAPVDAAAVTGDERLEAAIVAGEIAGPEAALERLKRPAASAELAEDAEVLRTLYNAGNVNDLSPEHRRGLIDRHEWFGKLAATYGVGDDNPERRAVLRAATRTLVALLVAFVLGGVALLTGFVLLVTAAIRWLDGRFVTAYRRASAPASTGPFLEAFAVYLAAMVGLSFLLRWLLGGRLQSIWFIIVIIPFTFLWPLLRGVPRADLRAGLGWHRGRGLWREAGAGVVGYLAGLPVLAAGAMVTLVLQRFSGSDTSHPIINEFGRGAWRTAQLFFLAAVWAPVVEETMFRGALYHHLRARLPWPAAAAIVALLFAAIHPQGWAAIPVLAAIALSLATIREWRGSIVASAVAHGINNGVVTILFVLLLS